MLRAIIWQSRFVSNVGRGDFLDQTRTQIYFRAILLKPLPIFFILTLETL